MSHGRYPPQPMYYGAAPFAAPYEAERKRQRRQTAGALLQNVFGKPTAPVRPQKHSNRPFVLIPPRGIGPIHDIVVSDVLCGRGGRINAHIGNVQFRAMVCQRKEEYLSKKKLAKAHIAAEIVYHVRGLGGRFLKEDPDGSWWDVGDQKAIKKVGQALREDASKEDEKDADGKDPDKTKAKKTPPNTIAPSTAMVSKKTMVPIAPLSMPAPTPTPAPKRVMAVSGRGAKRVTNSREPQPYDPTAVQNQPVSALETSAGVSFPFSHPQAADSETVVSGASATSKGSGKKRFAALRNRLTGKKSSPAVSMMMMMPPPPEEAFGRHFHPAANKDAVKESSLISGFSNVSDLSKSSLGCIQKPNDDSHEEYPDPTPLASMKAKAMRMEPQAMDLPDPTPLASMKLKSKCFQISTPEIVPGHSSLDSMQVSNEVAHKHGPTPLDSMEAINEEGDDNMSIEESSVPSIPDSIMSNMSEALEALDVTETSQL